jgi:hypothetical protein
MPPAPEGTPLTLSQQFAETHGLQRPAYDEGFVAEVGTPEEVITRQGEAEKTSMAKSAKRRAEEEDVRLERIYDIAASKSGPAWTKQVAALTAAAEAKDKQDKEDSYLRDMAEETRAQIAGSEKYQEAYDRAAYWADQGRRGSIFDLAVPGSRGAMSELPSGSPMFSSQFTPKPSAAGITRRTAVVASAVDKQPELAEYSGTLASLRGRAKMLEPAYDMPKPGSDMTTTPVPALMETPTQTISRERAEGIDTDSLDLQEAYGPGSAYGQAIAQTQDVANRKTQGEWAGSVIRNNRLNEDRKTPQPTPPRPARGPQIPLNNPTLGQQFLPVYNPSSPGT